jgi:hypothetical protein
MKRYLYLVLIMLATTFFTFSSAADGGGSYYVTKKIAFYCCPNGEEVLRCDYGPGRCKPEMQDPECPPGGPI